MGNEAAVNHPYDKIVKGTGKRVAVDTIYGIKSVSSGKWLDGRAGERDPWMSAAHRNPKHDVFLQWKVINAGNGIYALKSVSSSKWLDGRAGERDPWMSEVHRNPTHDAFLQWTFMKINGCNRVAIKSVSSNKWLDGRAGERDPLMSESHRNPHNDVFLQWEFIDPWETEKIHQQKMEQRQREIEVMKKQQEEQQKKIQQLQVERKNNLSQTKNDLVLHKNELQAKYNAIHKQLTDKCKQINEEEKLIYNFQAERNNKNQQIVLLIGNSGDGKSTFGNRLCGDVSEDGDDGPFEANDDNKSCTQNLQKAKCEKWNVTVVDCPGWNDSGGNDKTHLNNLCEYLRGCGGINCFVLIRNGTKRFDADFQNKLKIYDYHFGQDFWKHLVVVLTYIDQGATLRKFNKSSKVQQIKDDLSRLCQGENTNIAVMPMGLMDNYKDKLGVFIDAVPKNKFVCEHITSPIDDLRKEKTALMNQESEIREKMIAIENKITTITAQINTL